MEPHSSSLGGLAPTLQLFFAISISSGTVQNKKEQIISRRLRSGTSENSETANSLQITSSSKSRFWIRSKGVNA